MGRRLSEAWMAIRPLSRDEEFESAGSGFDTVFVPSHRRLPPELLQLLNLCLPGSCLCVIFEG